jgi:hypothetical protein
MPPAVQQQHLQLITTTKAPVCKELWPQHVPQSTLPRWESLTVAVTL